MAHIRLQEGLPGMRGLLAFRPETARPLSELADVLLHAPGPLPLADRELIGAYVSELNRCDYCRNSHAAIAACHLEGWPNWSPALRKHMTPAQRRRHSSAR
jgi:alkylhydroperoxidase family enzyme